MVGVGGLSPHKNKFCTSIIENVRGNFYFSNFSLRSIVLETEVFFTHLLDTFFDDAF